MYIPCSAIQRLRRRDYPSENLMSMSSREYVVNIWNDGVISDDETYSRVLEFISLL
jgi:hypothetical protein